MSLDLNNNLYVDSTNKLIFIRFQKTLDIPSGNCNITREAMGWFVPRGYRPLGLVGFEVTSAQVIVRGINAFHEMAANKNMIMLRNRKSSAYSNATVAVTYAFIENAAAWAKDTDIAYHDDKMYSSSSNLTWSDWERDLPENAGVLLTMENAGPVTNS